MHNSPRSGETPTHLKYLPGAGEEKKAHTHAQWQPSAVPAEPGSRKRRPAIALVAPAPSPTRHRRPPKLPAIREPGAASRRACFQKEQLLGCAHHFLFATLSCLSLVKGKPRAVWCVRVCVRRDPAPCRWEACSFRSSNKLLPRKSPCVSCHQLYKRLLVHTSRVSRQARIRQPG